METTNDLLAALNGGAPADAMPPYADIPGDAAPARDAELTLKPAPTEASPTKAADAKHSLAAGGKGYAVRVRGEYFANNPEGKGKVKRTYELDFNLPRLEGAGSIIKNRLLLPALRKKYADAVRHRTFHVVSATPLNAATPKSDNLAYMDRGQLEAAVASLKAPIITTSYPQTPEGTSKLRESIIDFVQNPDSTARDEKGALLFPPGSPKTFLARERERQNQRESDLELAAMNPDLEL